jgi:hypothetical protein
VCSWPQCGAPEGPHPGSGAPASYADPLLDRTNGQPSPLDTLVWVRRHWQDTWGAAYRLGDIRSMHWSNFSGGIMTRANRPYVHGYVWCGRGRGFALLPARPATAQHQDLHHRGGQRGHPVPADAPPAGCCLGRWLLSVPRRSACWIDGYYPTSCRLVSYMEVVANLHEVGR